MKNIKVISCVLLVVGILMVSMALAMNNKGTLKISEIKFEEIDMKSAATSANMKLGNDNTLKIPENKKELEVVEMNVSNASLIRDEVYAGLTMEELSQKFDRLLGSGYMAGKGYAIASYALERGVDPYIALAIIMHETGCGGNNVCSKLVQTCNNVGGQKGSPGCNGGAYKSFPTLDEGIRGFIDNLNRNYFSVGLTTIDSIAPKYAESKEWPAMIHYYVNKIANA